MSECVHWHYQDQISSTFISFKTGILAYVGYVELGVGKERG